MEPCLPIYRFLCFGIFELNENVLDIKQQEVAGNDFHNDNRKYFRYGKNQFFYSFFPLMCIHCRSPVITILCHLPGTKLNEERISPMLFFSIWLITLKINVVTSLLHSCSAIRFLSCHNFADCFFKIKFFNSKPNIIIKNWSNICVIKPTSLVSIQWHKWFI